MDSVGIGVVVASVVVGSVVASVVGTVVVGTVGLVKMSVGDCVGAESLNDNI